MDCAWDKCSKTDEKDRVQPAANFSIVTSTKNFSKDALCAKSISHPGRPSAQCCNVYDDGILNTGCVIGYSALWCRPRATRALKSENGFCLLDNDEWYDAENDTYWVDGQWAYIPDKPKPEDLTKCTESPAREIENEPEQKHNVESPESNLNPLQDPDLLKQIADMENGTLLHDPKPYKYQKWFSEPNCAGGQNVEFKQKLQPLDGFKVRVIPETMDALFHVVNKGSEAMKRTTRKSTITTQSNQSGWSVGAKSSRGVKDPRTGAEASIEISAEYSNTWSEETKIEVSTEDIFTCPPKTACKVSPVVFTLEVSGSCEVIPMTNWGYPSSWYGWFNACESPDNYCDQKKMYTRNNCPPKVSECSFQVPLFENEKRKVATFFLEQSLEDDNKRNVSQVASHVN